MKKAFCFILLLNSSFLFGQSILHSYTKPGNCYAKCFPKNGQFSYSDKTFYFPLSNPTPIQSENLKTINIFDLEDNETIHEIHLEKEDGSPYVLTDFTEKKNWLKKNYLALKKLIEVTEPTEKHQTIKITFKKEIEPKWREIVCENYITPQLLGHIATKLKELGYNVNLDNTNDKDSLFKELRNYQEDHNLAAGPLYIETLNSLGIKRNKFLDKYVPSKKQKKKK